MKVRLIQKVQKHRNVFLSFQFHEGSINTVLAALRLRLCVLYFNSMKVRLIQCLRPLHIKNKYTFQFHEGSINTAETPRYEATRPNFNSMKVRLIRLAICILIYQIISISIP